MFIPSFVYSDLFCEFVEQLQPDDVCGKPGFSFCSQHKCNAQLEVYLFHHITLYLLHFISLTILL